MFQCDCQPLIGFQITDAHDHPISVKGLADLQKSFRPRVPELKPLQPSKVRKWIILFVPQPVATSFIEQSLKDMKKVVHWNDKVT